jgi:hypothetical protein
VLVTADAVASEGGEDDEADRMKLTDSRLILLSKAAERDDGAAVVPDLMKKAAATKIGSSLVARKLMRRSARSLQCRSGARTKAVGLSA